MIKLLLTNTVKDRYYIYLNDEVVGVIEYIDYGDEIEIKYIKIHKEYRRMGIATRVINELKKEGVVITGDSLPEAIEFWKSVNASFYVPFENDDVILTPFCIN
jgi:ribosomal protein S18 acetylase RimI-like enzyme